MGYVVFVYLTKSYKGFRLERCKPIGIKATNHIAISAIHCSQHFVSQKDLVLIKAELSVADSFKLDGIAFLRVEIN